MYNIYNMYNIYDIYNKFTYSPLPTGHHGQQRPLQSGGVLLNLGLHSPRELRNLVGGSKRAGGPRLVAVTLVAALLDPMFFCEASMS